MAEPDNISALVDIVATDEEPTLEVTEEIIPSQLSMQASNENDSTPIFNEYELSMTETDARYW